MAAGTTASLIAAGAGDVVSILGGLAAGHQAEMASVTNAATVAEVGELNAQLIEQGSQLNAGVEDFNAAAMDMQATDAVQRGKEAEQQFRIQLKQTIGSQRANFAAQGVEIDSGSAVEVEKDTAYQGTLDALQIRTNAAREAWGYSIGAQGERLQAAATLQLGQLQASNTRSVAQANASNFIAGGNWAASAANWGAASSILQDAASLISKKYGL